MEKLDKNTGVWLAVGVGAAIAVPLLLPFLSAAARPLGRAVAKAGAVLTDKARETAAEFGEIIEDFVAEAQTAYEEHQLEKASAATAATTVAATLEGGAGAHDNPTDS